MSINIKDWLLRKEKAESANKQCERAAGAEEQLKAQLQKDFAITKIDKAKALVETMTKELAAAEKVCEQNIEEFDRKFADKLS